jgi:hypothetical protein
MNHSKCSDGCQRLKIGVYLSVSRGQHMCACLLWLPDCSKIQYTQFIFNTYILYSIHTFYIQYTLRIFNKRSNQIHQHNTRNASKLYKEYKRTNYAKHTLSNKGADVWNLLESNIKDINSCIAFKKQVKQHYLLN